MRKRRQLRDESTAARAHGEDELTPSKMSVTTTAPNALVALAAPVALFALVLGVYAKTLYPSVAGGDSGELVAESCHLGVSHPPGYPLFNMAVHTFALLLPWRSAGAAAGEDGVAIAWRANFFSAVAIYYCILHWTSDSGRQRGCITEHVPALAAAALFAFSPLIWTYAVGAEVFALNNLFAALLLLALARYSRSKYAFGNAAQGAFLCGLALCNQHTIVLFEIPIVAFVLYTRRRSLFTGREILKLSVAFLAGLLPYLYMPLTMSWRPQPGSWGDVTTLTGLFHHVRRGDYGTFRLFSTSEKHEDLWTRLYLYGVDLVTREIPLHLGIPVVSLGLLASLRVHRDPQQASITEPARLNGSTAAASPALGWVLLATYMFYMLVFHSLANLPLSEGLTYGVHMRFWQQPNVIVFIWLGIGLDQLLRIASRLVSRAAHAKDSVASPGAAVLGSLLCLALVGFQVASWYKLCDQSRAFYIRDYARALIEPLPANAVLFVNFDLQWTALRYLQRCEQLRTDVTVLNLSMMTFQWFATKHAHYPTLAFPGTRLVPFGSPATDGFTFASFLDANYEPLISSKRANRKTQRRGIFFGGKLNYQDRDFQHKYTFVPFGLLDEIHRKDEIEPSTAAAALPKQLKLSNWYPRQQRVMRMVHERLPTLPPGDLYSDETWEWTIARDYGMKTLSWSTYLLEKTIAEDPLNVTLLVQATHAMERSYQFEPLQFWQPVANLKNLGLAYAQIVKSSENFAVSGSDPFFNDAVGSGVADKSRLKDRASARMLEVWNAWLQLPEARRDPGFSAIESVVRQFLPQAERVEPQKRAKKTKKSKRKRAKKEVA